MASPLSSQRKTVDLAAPEVRVSRIRRDPPPKVKEISAREIKEREAWAIVVGVTAVALALVVILFGFGNVAGWSLGDYTIHLQENG